MLGIVVKLPAHQEQNEKEGSRIEYSGLGIIIPKKQNTLVSFSHCRESGLKGIVFISPYYRDVEILGIVEDIPLEIMLFLDREKIEGLTLTHSQTEANAIKALEKLFS